MTPHAYTEDQLVEQPAIGLFADLGWQTVSAMEETFGPDGTLGRETKGEVVLAREERREHSLYQIARTVSVGPPSAPPRSSTRASPPSTGRAALFELRNPLSTAASS